MVNILNQHVQCTCVLPIPAAAAFGRLQLTASIPNVGSVSGLGILSTIFCIQMISGPLALYPL